MSRLTGSPNETPVMDARSAISDNTALHMQLMSRVLKSDAIQAVDVVTRSTLA